MKKYLITLQLTLIFSAVCGLVHAQNLSSKINELPILQGEYKNGITNDWLVTGSKIPSGAFRNESSNEITLSNGLISRTLRLSPNVATVSLKKLSNQEELVRAVKPEAIISIDNFSIDVGGLEGQSNLAFLIPEWLDSLKTNPMSFQVKDFEIGPIKKRLEWAQIRHHETGAEWPPKGVHLKISCALDENLSSEQILSISQESKMSRETLLNDDFTSMSDDWQITTSPTHERSSFFNEGKPGEIYTPRNTSVYAEQALPKGVRLVETTVDKGTDCSSSWAPGIALLWQERKVKFTIQTGTEAGPTIRPFRFVVFDGKRELKRAGGHLNFTFDEPWSLRLRIDDDKIYCEAKPKNGIWKLIHTLVFDEPLSDPMAVRIGKLGKNAEGGDYSEPGELARLTFSHFAAYSEIKQDLLDQLNSNMEALKEITVDINYELYDGIPAFSKWIEVHNNSDKRIKVDEIVSEYLAVSDHNPTNKNFGRPDLAYKPNIHLETDYAFGAQKTQIANSNGIHWSSDQDYITQISFNRDIPNQVKAYPINGYHVFLESNKSLESIRAFVMPFDSFDDERNGLALRKMYRTVAPWITENPLMFHYTKSGWDPFKVAVEQCVEVGYEMINFSFGSGFRTEDTSEENYALIDKYVDYARERGIGVGTYSLLASRRISEEDDVINPVTGKRGGVAYFGNSPCLLSEWGLEYFGKMENLLGKDRFLTFTHDGSYPGDICASTTHPGHEGLDDSQYAQWKKISDFYKWCCSQGVYLRVPDYYYLVGQNQCPIGYRENNWSLPRRQQLIHARQNIFDGTWESTPSMRYSFIPLTQYHGGGAAATIEPLDEHIDHYEMMLACNLGLGVQSVLRGPRLYDTDKTKTMVQRMVNWYKKYRGILESDLLHLRKADGRDIDYMMHVNPELNEKGFLLVFNPTDNVIRKKIKVPLYYTGLTDWAQVREQENQSERFQLNRQYEIEIEVEVQPNWYNWYVIE